jgi:hypothetical protein
MKKILEITANIESRWFSPEFIIREEYINGLERDFNGDYLNIVATQIEQGQPFEIIDGNNLKFIRGVFDKLMNVDAEGNEEVLVVFVIGP